MDQFVAFGLSTIIGDPTALLSTGTGRAADQLGALKLRSLFHRLRTNGITPVFVSGGSRSPAPKVLDALGIHEREVRLGVYDKGAELDRLGRIGNVLAYVGNDRLDVEGPKTIGVPVVLFRWRGDDEFLRLDELQVWLRSEAGDMCAGVAFGVDELTIRLAEVGVSLSSAIGPTYVGKPSINASSNPSLSTQSGGQLCPLTDCGGAFTCLTPFAAR